MKHTVHNALCPLLQKGQNCHETHCSHCLVPTATERTQHTLFTLRCAHYGDLTTARVRDDDAVRLWLWVNDGGPVTTLLRLGVPTPGVRVALAVTVAPTWEPLALLDGDLTATAVLEPLTVARPGDADRVPGAWLAGRDNDAVAGSDLEALCDGDTECTTAGGPDRETVAVTERDQDCVWDRVWLDDADAVWVLDLRRDDNTKHDQPVPWGSAP